MGSSSRLWARPAAHPSGAQSAAPAEARPGPFHVEQRNSGPTSRTTGAPGHCIRAAVAPEQQPTLGRPGVALWARRHQRERCVTRPDPPARSVRHAVVPLQTDQRQPRCRPAARILRRRLAHDQLAAQAQQRCRALRHQGRRAEAPSDDRCARGAPGRRSAEDLSPFAHHLDPLAQPQSPNHTPQHVRAPLTRIHQHHVPGGSYDARTRLDTEEPGELDPQAAGVRVAEARRTRRCGTPSPDPALR